MNSNRIKIKISESLGEVSGEFIGPENAKVVMTLAHGAGAGMDHPFMKSLAIDLAQYGIATLRFNLHYMEKGKKRPDPPAIAHKVISAAIDTVCERYPQSSVIVSGKSFGGRMSSQLLATAPPSSVKGLVFYGFPLHPANQPGLDRADHLYHVKVPMLFLQGTRDALAEMSLVNKVVRELPLATLEVIENADHSFKVGKKDSIVDLSKKTENWLKGLNIL
jgi:predicted alpha/beta-hydrolase family hydrolase